MLISRSTIFLHSKVCIMGIVMYGEKMQNKEIKGWIAGVKFMEFFGNMTKRGGRVGA